MRHFIHLPDRNKPKNKLQEKLADLLETYDHTITTNSDQTVKRLKEAVEEFNAEFPRCKPLKVHTWKSGKDGFGVGFSDYWTCVLIFYQVKETE